MRSKNGAPRLKPEHQVNASLGRTACPAERGVDKKVIVGMSGGVDSSIALVLLKQQGYEPIGVSLKYSVWRSQKNCLRENICCSTESFNIARSICKKFGAPYHVLNVEQEFKQKVIGYFLTAEKQAKTPNPCLVCNPELKFEKLFMAAKKYGATYVATGHYAGVKRNPKSKKFELHRPKDQDKDQTYSLAFLPQKWLGRILFPLSDYTKTEVYQLAEKLGLSFFTKRKQSQDFCFVAGKSMAAFLREKIGLKPGKIVDLPGKVLGQHQGLHFYTIGQRQGIGLPGGPYYVSAKDAARNILLVTKDERRLGQREVMLGNCHFISGASPKKVISVLAKIRYRASAAQAKLYPMGQNQYRLVFNQPQRAVTPGQFAVFYQGQVCLGGGEIKL